MDNILTMNTGTTATTGTPTKGPIREFLGATGRLILDPVRFFREDFAGFGLSQALTFGLINAWLATVVGFFVDTLHAALFSQLLDRWAQRLLFSAGDFSFFGVSAQSFVWSAAFILLAPFFLLARIFASGLVVYLFARLLAEDDPAAPEPIAFPAVIRIQAAAYGGRWFMVVPFVGGLLSFFVVLILTITGVRERFGLSNRRAAAIVLAPYLLLLVAGIFMLVILGIALTQLPYDEMLGGYLEKSRGFGWLMHDLM